MYFSRVAQGNAQDNGVRTVLWLTRKGIRREQFLIRTNGALLHSVLKNSRSLTTLLILRRFSITFTANVNGKMTTLSPFSRLTSSVYRFQREGGCLRVVNNVRIYLKFWNRSATITTLCSSPVLLYLLFYVK